MLMASPGVHLPGAAINADSSPTTGRSRRKPRTTGASPNPQQHNSTSTMPPLTISLPSVVWHSRSSSQGAAATAAAAAENVSTTQTAQVSQQQQQQPGSDEVVLVSSDDGSDDDVIITGVKPPTKRPRLQQPAQQPAAAGRQQQPPGRRVERGLHGGYFVMPTWDQQPQPVAQQAPPREASPEPAFKCLVCLEGIKPDNMGITACGHMYCYSCIADAVKATKRCPKCRKGLQLKGLKRIYPN